MNNLLETLDTNVGDVVENQTAAFYEEEDDDGSGLPGGVGGQSSVDDILAKRGLLNQEEDDDEEEEEMEDDMGEYASEKEVDQCQSESRDIDNQASAGGNEEEEGLEKITNESQREQQLMTGTGVVVLEEDVDPATGDELKSKDSSSLSLASSRPSSPPNDSQDLNESAHDSSNTGKEDDALENTSNEATTTTSQERNERSAHTSSEPITAIQPNDASELISLKKKIIELEKNQMDLSKFKQSLVEQKKLTKEAQKTSNESNKEVRKLRRTVVKLNAELDSTEREMDAQRTELERAATRIDKDRQRYKMEKEQLQKGHKENIASVQSEHKISMEAMVTSHGDQITVMKERIERAEEARVREGGDMSKELTEAVSRERETMKKVLALEDEKSTLTTQVSSLNTQLAALQSRLESVQTMADSASEQEREADDRLDAALSLHARQMSQRQAREAELERNIADLGAALVVAREKEAQNSNRKDSNYSSDSSNAIEILKEKLTSMADELESMSEQIMLERQRSETLQSELEDIVKERTQDNSVFLTRQKEFDRRIADLTASNTQLQALLRANDRGTEFASKHDNSIVSSKENDLERQISSLSEELIRLRGRFENSSTELLTLRNRLRAALTRADAAEKAAAKAQSDFDVYDVERGSLNQYPGNKVRRRMGGRVNKKVVPLSTAIKLDQGRGDARQVAKTFIDTVDTLAIEVGSYFRNDAIARGFFLLYLVLIHLWAFALVIFHAHGSLEPPADIGPSQLLEHSYRHMEQIGSSSTP